MLVRTIGCVNKRLEICVSGGKLNNNDSEKSQASICMHSAFALFGLAPFTLHVSACVFQASVFQATFVIIHIILVFNLKPFNHDIIERCLLLFCC